MNFLTAPQIGGIFVHNALIPGAKARLSGTKRRMSQELPRGFNKAWFGPRSPILSDPPFTRQPPPLNCEHMTETPPSENPPEHEKSRLRRFEDAVDDRLLAAEVAAEAAAGYGSLTADRGAAETAAKPQHEPRTQDAGG